MVDYAIFKNYLAQIEQACKADNATEHTHRPALKSLLEAFQPGIIATNEPKRIKCGAPDYIITRKDIPLGPSPPPPLMEPLAIRLGGEAAKPLVIPQAGEGSPGRVWINQKQYFDNVPPEIWNYHIGGYQVCQKWLKDRKGRQLSYDDLTHYRCIIAALTRTIEIQAAIDETIGGWPMR